MTSTRDPHPPDISAFPPRPLRYAAPAALAWSLLATAVGAGWAAGYPVGYEYGATPVHAGIVGSVLVAVGVAGVVVATVLIRAGRPGARRPSPGTGYPVAGVALVLAAALVVVGPGRLLLDLLQLALGVAPAPAGFAVRSAGLLGGIVWGAAGIVHLRRVRGACVRCGRSRHEDGPRPRWRSWAILAATVAPIPYSLQRLCWAIGLPVGIQAAALHQLHADLGGFGRIGLVVLVLLSEGGAFLVHGLGRPWGRTVPRWVPWLGGRRVPPAVAIVPATAVALLLTALIGYEVKGTLDGESADPWLASATAFDLALGQGLLILLLSWGPLIGLATYAYHLDRRGPCPAATGVVPVATEVRA